MCEKITSLCLLAIPLLLTALHAQNPPPYPPNDWQLNVRNINANFYTVVQQADSFFINNPSAPGYKDYSRWVTFWESRVGTSQEPGSFKPAFNALSALFDLSPQDVCDHSSGFASKWTSIGPSQTPGTNFINQGWAGGAGVVSKVMFKAGDPTHNTIYLGTGSSGLWVTKNANNTPDQVTWVNLTDNSNLPTLGVTSFDINPSNPQEIYVASALTPHLPGFGYGLGIIKTTDGGATWQRSGLTYDPNLLDDNNKRITCLDVKIHPTMNHVVFAICGDVIWKSTDAGDTFTNVFELNDDNLPFRELVFHPSNPNTIYASSDDVESNDGGAELFVSYNGGDLKQAIQDSLAVVEYMISAGTGKAPIQAKAMHNYANGIQWYPPVVLPDGGNAPLSRSDAGTALTAPLPKVATNKLVILPNPSSGQVTIQYALDLETTRAAIEITDMEGKNIMLLPVSDFKGEIQLADSRLLPGIYAVRLLVDDFPVRIQKLVIIK